MAEKLAAKIDFMPHHALILLLCVPSSFHKMNTRKKKEEEILTMKKGIIDIISVHDHWKIFSLYFFLCRSKRAGWSGWYIKLTTQSRSFSFIITLVDYLNKLNLCRSILPC